MGEVEIDHIRRIIIVSSHIITYGTEAKEDVTERIRQEIELMWNEPAAYIFMHGQHFRLLFTITAEATPEIQELDVLQNTDPRNNYFRIEKFVHGNISFV